MIVKSQQNAALAYQKRLNDNYQSACKRAERRGRKLPSKEEYYDHWGHKYYSKDMVDY